MGYTQAAQPAELEEKWYVVDARDQLLGTLASDIAGILRGKHLTQYSPHVNMKTHVIVLNADKVHLTGDKWQTKKYYHHTNWPGGIRSYSARQLNDRKPGELVRKAVWGMLPKNRLGRATMKRLRLFVGDDHNHSAQKPVPMPRRNEAVTA